MSDEQIMPGAEPFFFKGNDIGVLVCHGFTGTTQSMRYLGEQLHGHPHDTGDEADHGEDRVNALHAG